MQTFRFFSARIPQAVGGIAFGAAVWALSAPCAHAQVLFQQFTYPIDTPPQGQSWWQASTGQLPALAKLGVWGVWNPIPVKGGSGAQSMGYDPYDLYDLGSKNQKGTIPTQFGTKADYLTYVAVAHANGLRVISDVVLNHTGGADKLQENPIMARLSMNDVPDPTKVPAKYLPDNFDFAAPHHLSWTWYAPVGASGVPGTGRFPRNYRHFHPSETHPDRNEPYHKNEFLEDFCFEADNNYVGRNLQEWGVWFRNQTGVDGYRLDAVKIQDPSFVDAFARTVTTSAAVPKSNTPFYLVGEFWDTNQKLLGDFQTATHNQMKLFDFGLFYALWDMTEKPGTFDMHDLLNRRLVDRDRAVMFVSNHDVDRFQPINRQKRALPYAVVLAMGGQPSVFYKDYFGAEDARLPHQMETLVGLHNRFAVGRETVRLVDKSVLVIEREKNLLACFNSGGADSAPRTVTVQTAWGKNVALRVAATSDTKPANAAPLVTGENGSVIVTVPSGGFVWLVRADATNKTNPDRFAPKPAPTTQTWEFADDLDTGELSAAPKTVTVYLVKGSPFSALLRQNAEPLEIRLDSPSGASVDAVQTTHSGKANLTLKTVPETGVYQVMVSAEAPKSATHGTLQITYSAPARL